MSYMDMVRADNSEMAEEAKYRVEWLNQHHTADQAIFDKDGMPIAAVYLYPPKAHYAENQSFWNTLARLEPAE